MEVVKGFWDRFEERRIDDCLLERRMISLSVFMIKTYDSSSRNERRI